MTRMIRPEHNKSIGRFNLPIDFPSHTARVDPTGVRAYHRFRGKFFFGRQPVRLCLLEGLWIPTTGKLRRSNGLIDHDKAATIAANRITMKMLIAIKRPKKP